MTSDETRVYGEDPQPQKRYSPAKGLSDTKDVVQGNLDPALISASYAEPCSLTMHRSMRRFTRLASAFSKKVENVAHALAIHFMAYNFVKPHGTLTKVAGATPTTPAMAAGAATRPWKLGEVIDLLGSD